MPKRAYDNSLRAGQAEQTRERILEAALDLYASQGELSTGEIAARAAVSEPTVYRHFPNRDALLTAVAEYASTNLGSPPMVHDANDMVPVTVAVALYFGRNATWMRAGMNNPVFRDIRARGRKRRLAEHRKLLDPVLAHLEEHDQKVAFAALAAVQRMETWDYLVTEHGLSDEDAGRGIAFVYEACLAQLAKLKRDRQARVVSDATTRRGRELDAEAQTRVKKKGRA